MPTVTPSIISDGNFALREFQSVEYDFPFSDVGDNATFQATATYRIDKASYRPQAIDTVANFTLGNAFLIKLGRPRDIGCGMYEVQDVYSTVPATRLEYGSFTYTLQAYESTGTSNVDPTKYFYSVTFDLEEQTFTVPATFKYEYFHLTAPNPLLRARAFMWFGRIYIIGGSPVLGGSQIVAEDSQVKIYGGRIWERRTPLVNIAVSLIG